MTEAPIRLTQTVKKGGCAAKIPAQVLRRMLGHVKFPKATEDLIVDAGLFDDAAVVKLSDDQAAVLTLDFFTPIVDSPKLFGKIAAANALSDVYAMGGRPMTCMSILAFPTSTLPEDVGVEMLNGACEVIAEAGAFLVGGHSIDDDTLKFGLSVMGVVHPDRIWKNSLAKIGDKLILTKGLGTGTLTAALKNGHFSEGDLESTWTSMTTLNNLEDSLDKKLLAGIHGATDITGFGLLGHSLQMSQASKVSLVLTKESIPVLPKARESLQKEFLTKAHRTNREYVSTSVDFGSLNSSDQLICLDPQTSGGLLLSVDPSLAASMVSALKRKFPMTAEIGEVQDHAEGRSRISFR